MLKQRAVAMGFVLGWTAFLGACAAVVDESDESAVEAEDVGEEQDALEMALPPGRLPVRIRRPNPIDPGGRLLHCLPDPRKEYLSRDTEDCARIRFYCDAGVPFFDRCGCGCEVGLSE